MGIEIERKFLVKNDDFKQESYQHTTIKQGFLNSNKNRIVRIRISDTLAFITVKGKSNLSGTTRFEWEKEINIIEAEELLLLCEPSIIEKIRYYIRKGNHTFEIDVFLGKNKGLIVAEIELASENESFEKPDWLGKEVTGKIKYYNSNLSNHPYKSWT
jgi:CYTH domain-containing protein